MDSETLNRIIENRCQRIKAVLSIKNKEYAPNRDALHNFKRGGKMLDKTPESILIGFWMKHIISILDIVDSLPLNAAPGQVNLEMLDEKIGDAVNYLILLESLIIERNELKPVRENDYDK